MPSSTYLSTAELKSTLNIGSTYADADIADAIVGASRVCDAYKNTRFWATTETRYYTGCPGELELDIDDVSNVATFSVDTAGDRTYGTDWTEGTDYYLGPRNAGVDGYPYRRIVIYQQSGRRFPAGYDNNVRITGNFGWSTTPTEVKAAAKILAGRYLKRARETPNGLQAVIGESVAIARLGRVDPDVATLLDSLNKHGQAPLLFL